jgi:flagellar biosynthesis/type III secretory pathway M-ring protein FliF/YscJ
MSATALYLLLGLVLAFAGVFAALFSGEKRVPPRAPEAPPRRRPARTPPKAGSTPAGTAPPPSRSRPLSRREREEMLNGIRNLVRDNPARTASLVRSWLNA